MILIVGALKCFIPKPNEDGMGDTPRRSPPGPAAGSELRLTAGRDAWLALGRRSVAMSCECFQACLGSSGPVRLPVS